MKKLMLAMGISAATLLSGPALADTYMIDTKGAHASVNFKVPHLGYSFIKGRFNKFDGQFEFDPNNIGASSVTVTVDTTSLDSNQAERDKHIRSADFLNASKFGQATFKSTKVTDNGDGSMTIAGDLTLHGQTKPIEIDAELVGHGDDPWGNYRAGFMGNTRLELADFGIATMGPATYVDMELHVEGIRQ
ncbi:MULTISPECIES: YceI family protein [unclassified Salinivibrio]|uniref:YceI family protein n=1 Tax=unclassified Salinivibrio TaxID=2636825 RepID=UPI00084C24DF|nr:MULTISPECIES: YceI family protein [unclassified Salinivibrio]ODQ00068.1 hypothetical protein BGK46_08695 [Salinivibrio sp. DV]OOF22895.1 hypothetical protein BZJ17_05085 [Salinivibrio sp. IB574]